MKTFLKTIFVTIIGGMLTGIIYTIFRKRRG